MPAIDSPLVALFALYALVTGIFIISENRRPQSTLAWLLSFYFVPVLGVLIYFFFGRDRKAFSRQDRLLKQDVEENAPISLTRLVASQDETIARLGGDSTIRRRLMMLVQRNSHAALTTGNDVTLQQNASSFYPHLIADIEQAQHSVHLQYYIWRADDFTEYLKEVLIAKARAGVEVRLLYDVLGSRLFPHNAYSRALRDAGVAMAPTSPWYHVHTIGYRNHRKITVVDGRIGYTGGMNIGQEHLDGGAGFAWWRDTQLRAVGPAAGLLQAVFATDWYNAVGESLFADVYYPEVTHAGERPNTTDVPMQMVTSGPDSEWAAIRQLYVLMIASAQRRVVIQSPFFVPDASLVEALTSAALAGVDVELMISESASGTTLPTWAGWTYMAEVAAAGVKVYLYEEGYLHAKAISIDSEICSIGSANIDIRSFSINYELNAVIYSKRLARQFEDAFERDRAHCRLFDEAAYMDRGHVLRFRDSLARLLSPLL